MDQRVETQGTSYPKARDRMVPPNTNILKFFKASQPRVEIRHMANKDALKGQ